MTPPPLQQLSTSSGHHETHGECHIRVDPARRGALLRHLEHVKIEGDEADEWWVPTADQLNGLETFLHDGDLSRGARFGLWTAPFGGSYGCNHTGVFYIGGDKRRYFGLPDGHADTPARRVESSYEIIEPRLRHVLLQNFENVRMQGDSAGQWFRMKADQASWVKTFLNDAFPGAPGSRWSPVKGVTIEADVTGVGYFGSAARCRYLGLPADRLSYQTVEPDLGKVLLENFGHVRIQGDSVGEWFRMRADQAECVKTFLDGAFPDAPAPRWSPKDGVTIETHDHGIAYVGVVGRRRYLGLPSACLRYEVAKPDLRHVLLQHFDKVRLEGNSAGQWFRMHDDQAEWVRIFLEEKFSGAPGPRWKPIAGVTIKADADGIAYIGSAGRNRYLGLPAARLSAARTATSPSAPVAPLEDVPENLLEPPISAELTALSGESAESIHVSDLKTFAGNPNLGTGAFASVERRVFNEHPVAVKSQWKCAHTGLRKRLDFIRNKKSAEDISMTAFTRQVPGSAYFTDWRDAFDLGRRINEVELQAMRELAVEVPSHVPRLCGWVDRNIGESEVASEIATDTTWAGRPCGIWRDLVMEEVHVVENRKAWNEHDYRRFFHSAITGLDGIHGAGWVHKDLHPGNVLAVPGPSAVFIDFGSSSRTTATEILELSKLPPEVRDFKRCAKSDSARGSCTIVVQDGYNLRVIDLWQIGIMNLSPLCKHFPESTQLADLCALLTRENWRNRPQTAGEVLKHPWLQVT